MKAQAKMAVTDHDEDGGDVAIKGAGVSLGPLAGRLGYALRRAQIAVFRDFFAAFAEHDIRPAQYSILTVIEANPGLKQTQVCDALGIKRTNFVAMIDELEARDLVRRDAAPGDRRSHALVLTRAGAELTPRLHRLSEAHERRIVACLGEVGHARMLEAMRSLAEALESAPE